MKKLLIIALCAVCLLSACAKKQAPEPSAPAQGGDAATATGEPLTKEEIDSFLRGDNPELIEKYKAQQAQ